MHLDFVRDSFWGRQLYCSTLLKVARLNNDSLSFEGEFLCTHAGEVNTLDEIRAIDRRQEVLVSS